VQSKRLRPALSFISSLPEVSGVLVDFFAFPWGGETTALSLRPLVSKANNCQRKKKSDSTFANRTAQPGAIFTAGGTAQVSSISV